MAKVGQRHFTAELKRGAVATNGRVCKLGEVGKSVVVGRTARHPGYRANPDLAQAIDGILAGSRSRLCSFAIAASNSPPPTWSRISNVIAAAA